MNTPNESNTQTDLDRVLAKITEIVEKSADADYIYRGEPEHYEKVCSTLYREYPRAEWIPFDIPQAQEDMLEEAKAYIGRTDDIDETDDIAILTQLQHFGGKTNLIDFTEDYLIALFFACDGSHDKEGRVILIKEKSVDYKTEKPRRTINRVESQKSVFVESPIGFVEPDSVVTIPVDLKLPVLDYLRKYHRISIEAIYNDMHGFIRRNAYMEFLRGATYQDKAQKAKTREKKDKHCEKAIRHYTEALKLKPNLSFVYNNRGNVYRMKGEVDTAIKDYNKAIEMKPDNADAYNNRGNVYRMKGEVDTAIKDYNNAIDLKPEFVEVYNNRGIAYAKKGKVDTAIKDFSKAIEMKPDNADAYYNRGLVYAVKGEVDTAIKDFSKAIDLKPDNAKAYNNRGNAYAVKGEVDTAIKDYNNAIDLEPDDAKAYNNRGMMWLRQAEWKNAKTDLMTARNIGADIAATFHNGYESVEDFEAEHGVQVPEDIAALLSRD